MSEKIDLKGLDKAAVLAALFNASKPQGMGFMHYDPAPMTVEQAAELLKRSTYFDYLQGRVMKIELSDDTLDPWSYDRDNGEGAAAATIASLQKTSDVNNDAIAKTHKDSTFLSAVTTESMLHSVSGFSTDPSEPVQVFRLGLDDFAPVLGPKVREAKLANMDEDELSGFLCMCNSFDCALSVDVPISEAVNVFADEKNVVIIDGCQKGPKPTDTLIEKRKGYTLYRES